MRVLVMVDQLITIVILAAASACLSVTVTKSHMFLWFRALFVTRPTLLQLVSCYYCMGHWFALALVAINYTWWPEPVSFVVAWLAVTGLSGLISARIIGD